MAAVPLSEAARRLGVSVEEIQKRVQRGELKSARVVTASGIGMGVELPDEPGLGQETATPMTRPSGSQQPLTAREDSRPQEPPQDQLRQRYTPEELSTIFTPQELVELGMVSPAEPSPTQRPDLGAPGSVEIEQPPPEPAPEVREAYLSQQAAVAEQPQIIVEFPREDIAGFQEPYHFEQAAPPQYPQRTEPETGQPYSQEPTMAAEPQPFSQQTVQASPESPPQPQAVFGERVEVPFTNQRPAPPQEPILQPDEEKKKIPETPIAKMSGTAWSELVRAVRSQVDDLREELASRRREVQELHVLLQQLQVRVLPPPQEPQQHQGIPTEMPSGAGPAVHGPSNVRETQPESMPAPKKKAPWWKFTWR